MTHVEQLMPKRWQCQWEYSISAQTLWREANGMGRVPEEGDHIAKQGGPSAFGCAGNSSYEPHGLLESDVILRLDPPLPQKVWVTWQGATQADFIQRVQHGLCRSRQLIHIKNHDPGHPSRHHEPKGHLADHSGGVSVLCLRHFSHDLHLPPQLLLRCCVSYECVMMALKLLLLDNLICFAKYASGIVAHSCDTVLNMQWHCAPPVCHSWDLPWNK